MGIRHKIAENAPYISTIGVSLALVREQMERNVANPTDEDIRKIRHDIMEVITRQAQMQQRLIFRLKSTARKIF